MNRPSTHWSERMYGLVVALYPRAFRERYGPDMRLAFHDLLEDPDMPTWRIWLSVLRDLRGSFLQEHLASLNENLAIWTGGLSMTRHQLPSSSLVRRGVVIGCAVVLWCTIVLTWIMYRGSPFSGGDVLGGFGIVMGAVGLGIAAVGLAIDVLTRGWPRNERHGFGPPPRE
jgi:hypothetical protein